MNVKEAIEELKKYSPDTEVGSLVLNLMPGSKMHCAKCGGEFPPNHFLFAHALDYPDFPGLRLEERLRKS